MRYSIKVDKYTDFQLSQRIQDRAGKAILKGINNAAFGAKKDVDKDIKRTFDRPTPFIQKSVKVTRATLENLKAIVFVANPAAERVLLPHIEGGDRVAKGFERTLRRMGLMRPDEKAIPSRSAPIDKYGNVPLREIRGIVDALRGKRSKYFAGAPGNGGVQYVRGIWERLPQSRIRPVFVFVSEVRYKETFGFYAVASKGVSERFAERFKRSMGESIGE
jgi:hypothetical protein